MTLEVCDQTGLSKDILNHLSYNLTNHLLYNLTKFNETFIYTLMNFVLYNLKESFIIQFRESLIYLQFKEFSKKPFILTY